MRAILKYDMNDIDDRREFYLASNAGNLSLVLTNLLSHLRSEIKYGEDEVKIDHLEELRAKLFEIMGDHNIDLDKLD